MDSNTLKAFVIEHKEKGMSYQEIANKLMSEHGVKRTRQALQGIYARATDGSSQVEVVVNSHIINLAALGYRSTDIEKEMEKLGYRLSYRYITNTVKESESIIDEVIRYHAEKIIENRGNLLSIDGIKDLINYKGIDASDRGIDIIIKRAYTEIIKDSLADILAELYKLTDDRKLVKDIMDETIIDINMADVENKVI